MIKKPTIKTILSVVLVLSCSTNVHAKDDDGEVLDFIPAIVAALAPRQSNGVLNGWFVKADGSAIWGYAGHNSWWDSKATMPNLTRNAGSELGPLKTVEFDKLITAMLAYGYPGFEHNYGLWYDRRRDNHGVTCRLDDNVIGPVLEQPWARSNIGRACDGKPLYDLTTFNQYYFDRLRGFAAEAQARDVVFIHNFYMQHALVLIDTHYADFPWRPRNAVQQLSMPDGVPAGNSFYNIADPAKRALHTLYIDKVLDSLGEFPNVVHLVSMQYTGGLEFVQFWIDTIKAWEARNGKKVHISLGATKDVQDAILLDPVRSKYIRSINLQYWWYKSDGTLFAPPSAQEVDGRYSSGFESALTSSQQIYKQVREYREQYPGKALLHKIAASRQQVWAFLMGGGAMLMRYLNYSSAQETNYVAPIETDTIQASYDFVNRHLRPLLPKMLPADLSLAATGITYGLSDSKTVILYYTTSSGSFRADLSKFSGQFQATRFDPATGVETNLGIVNAGDSTIQFAAPSNGGWAILLKKI